MSTVAEIKTAVRVQIQEFAPLNITQTTIEHLINSAVVLLWNKIKSVAPEYLTRRKSISSETNLFVWPSDCMSLLNIWDMRTTAGTITGATNATPIVISQTAHGFSTAQIITIHDVVGNTAANGTHAITKVGDDSYSLDSVAGTDDYTSGGKAFQETSSFTEIQRITLDRSRGQNRNTWHSRGKIIVVNLNSFSNDVIIDYLTSATPALADIPAEFHEAIISFCIVKSVDSQTAGPALMSLNLGIWNDALLSIAESFQMSNAPQPNPKGIDWDGLANYYD